MKTLCKALALVAFMAIASAAANAEQRAQPPVSPASRGSVPTAAVISFSIFRFPLPHEPRRPGP